MASGALSQDALRGLWRDGPEGKLSAMDQAKAWALREAWKELRPTPYGMLVFVAKNVEKSGGGHPSTGSLMEFFAKVDADPEWFPGKHSGQPRGPLPVLRGAKKAAVARSAMAMKEAGIEPTYRLVVGKCPDAVRNPETGEPVDKKRVYTVMKEACYDDDPERPWKHQRRLSRTTYPAWVMERRLAWALWMQTLRHTAAWYFRFIIWTDICHSILPRTEKKATEQALARKGGMGWQSDGSQQFSSNLRGRKEVLKQNAWDTERVWWFPALIRGKLHLDLLPAAFPGETPEGAATLVAALRAAVNVRVRGSKPKALFVDRGRGFYSTGTGGITPEFAQALKEHEFRAFMGVDAAKQPGFLADVLLHETAVSWVRELEAKTTPAAPWRETREAFGERLRQIARRVNEKHKVANLCRKLPARLQGVIEREGDRIPH